MRVLCCCCCSCYWLLLLLVLAAPWPAEGLVCISHHEYYEDGKTRVINLGRCGSSNGFCVKAHYWDKDESQKRGFSRGCDKNDCVHFGEQEYGWRPDGCRKHKDFGSEGLICCCQRDLCNGSPALGFSISTLFTFYLLLVLSSLLLRSILF